MFTDFQSKSFMEFLVHSFSKQVVHGISPLEETQQESAAFHFALDRHGNRRGVDVGGTRSHSEIFAQSRSLWQQRFSLANVRRGRTAASIFKVNCRAQHLNRYEVGFFVLISLKINRSRKNFSRGFARTLSWFPWKCCDSKISFDLVTGKHLFTDRLSAVFGGTFCLRRSAVGLVLDKESLQLKAIVDTQGMTTSCSLLLLLASSSETVSGHAVALAVEKLMVICLWQVHGCEAFMCWASRDYLKVNKPMSSGCVCVRIASSTVVIRTTCTFFCSCSNFRDDLAICFSGQKIKCKHLVIDEASVPDQYRCDFTNAIARAVYVTNKSVLSSDSEHVSKSYRCVINVVQCFLFSA